MSDNNIDDLAGDYCDEKAASDLATRLRLRLYASNLPHKGLALANRGPDTYAEVITMSDGIPQSSSEKHRKLEGYVLGRTEIVQNDCHPQWTQTIILEYEYGSQFYFYVNVFEHTKSRKKSDPKSLGMVLFEVGDILGTRQATKAKRLRRGNGCVFCHLEPVKGIYESRRFRFQFAAKDLLLPNASHANQVGSFRTSQPDTSFEIIKVPEEVIIYRSQIFPESVNPMWDVAEIDLGTIYNGDLKKDLRIVVSAIQKNGKRMCIGIAETSLLYLIHSVLPSEAHGIENKEVRVTELTLQRNSFNLKHMGKLLIHLAEIVDGNGSKMIEEHYDTMPPMDLASLIPISAPVRRSLQDYLDHGCKIGVCIAIDYTSSNGDPLQETSLHYICDDCLNDYEATISAICDALSRYVEGEEYTVWGFGAKFGDQVRHLFQCGSSPTVRTVAGILAAYKSVFAAGVIMSGPTVFAHAIQAAAVKAKKQHDLMTSNDIQYTILLIITDGNMDDFEDTKRKIALYQDMPLSVIFVGVGRADFGMLVRLCQEHTNTTFVEFRIHQHDPNAIGQAALQHIPDQLCNYMRMRNF